MAAGESTRLSIGSLGQDCIGNISPKLNGSLLPRLLIHNADAA
jgi:hypothetical protein